jgi:peptidoglycan/LPS O-acetylase OafA/YrhL
MSSPTRIRGADGLRAFACCAVVLHHLFQRLNPEKLSQPLSTMHFIGMRGEVGVSIFFVLSGALLSYPFWLAHLAGANKPSLRDYFINRAARIAPATWLNISVVTLVTTLIYTLPFEIFRAASGMLFISSFHYTTFFPTELNGPLWSISLEVWCYVMLPIIIFSIIRNKCTYRASMIRLMLWITFLQVLNPLLIKVFMTSTEQKGWEFGLVGGAKQWLPYWNIDTFFTQFLLGSLAALFLAHRKISLKPAHLSFDVGAIISFIGALTLVLTRLTAGVPDSITNQPYVAPWFSLLVAFFLGCCASSTFIWKLVDNRATKFIATISFGIYLWHYFIISIIANSFVKDFQYFGLNSISMWSILAIIVLGLSTLIATVSWLYFEKPIINRVKVARNKLKGG